MTPETEFIAFCGQISVALLSAALALVLWRLARGPTAADRVIAMDLMSMLVIAFLVTASIIAPETSYLDVAIAYACIAFLGAIALARFISRATRGQSDRCKAEVSDD
ncbi:MAG: monovalent cation/H+ antiporter complex subunit F [Desulfobacterales bacterium]|jgi:multicomponent Na+:H+ antiporter subunit F